MKKYFNLLFISLILISCETKTVEVETGAGEWLMEGDRFGWAILQVIKKMQIL